MEAMPMTTPYLTRTTNVLDFHSRPSVEDRNRVIRFAPSTSLLGQPRYLVTCSIYRIGWLDDEIVSKSKIRPERLNGLSVGAAESLPRVADTINGLFALFGSWPPGPLVPLNPAD
jgi:hypothetical protein